MGDRRVSHDRVGCAAARAALYLDPSGLVSACCANGTFVYGRISEGADSDTLSSIWQGARRARLEQALSQGDYSLGCHECETGIRRGRRDDVLARDFDRYLDTSESEFPSYIDFALSNTCNLQCVMCNGDLSSAIRGGREGRPPLPEAYGDRFVEELREFLPHLRDAGFKGGEPFLSRTTRRVWDMMIEAPNRPRVTVTTNGTVWNDRVDRYVRELRMHVILSVDGRTADTVESLRVGVRYPELLRNLERFHDATTASGGSLTLNYCFMPQNWHEFGEFLMDAERRELRVHVVPVVAPPSFDVTQLPLEQRREVLHQLEQQDLSLAPSLELNRAAWTTQIDRVRAAVAAGAIDPTGIEVSIGVSETDISRRLGELRRSTGGELLDIWMKGGVVASVSAPEWAAGKLDPTGWLGVGERDLPSRIADDVGGGYPDIELTEHSPHVASVRLRFATGVVLRGVVAREPASGRMQRAHLGLDRS